MVLERSFHLDFIKPDCAEPFPIDDVSSIIRYFLPRLVRLKLKLVRLIDRTDCLKGDSRVQRDSRTLGWVKLSFIFDKVAFQGHEIFTGTPFIDRKCNANQRKHHVLYIASGLQKPI